MDKRDIDKLMNSLVFFRGTRKGIIRKVKKITKRDATASKVKRSASSTNDFILDVNVGMLDDAYLDYEVCVLPTNKKKVYLITEVIPF